ncbi:MAG: hypothetical protein CFH22_00713 [Alphaproteobacteria bacterium MarineAlpha5_Bin12]|nr:MAG: hypothetical protein CFH22_00713 [Alphaproteobacteria bacterium MarineAlpha5_Bin12]
MKYFIIFIFTIFMSLNLFSQEAYVMDNNNPGTKKC